MTLSPNPPEQEVMTRIVELRASGMALGAIARSTAAEKAATRQGGRWAPKTVLAIIRRHERVTA